MEGDEDKEQIGRGGHPRGAASHQTSTESFRDKEEGKGKSCSEAMEEKTEKDESTSVRCKSPLDTIARLSKLHVGTLLSSTVGLPSSPELPLRVTHLGLLWSPWGQELSFLHGQKWTRWRGRHGGWWPTWRRWWTSCLAQGRAT